MFRATRHPHASLFGRDIGFGQALLGIYITVVIVLTVIRDTLGAPFLAELASTPHALIHGAWWQLFTSGLVVDGPLLPQIAAVGVLGTLGIYFRGSWLFWLTAVISHILGTIVTYIGVGVAWLIHPGWVDNLLRQQDYGISLIWCAALGMVAAASWLGPDSTRRPIYKPVILLSTVVVMTVVTWFSLGLARYEHLAAFSIAFLIVVLTPQHRHISKRLTRSLSKRRGGKAAGRP
jgi:membrane-bound metal-dependent hydrolase YbcI (DUF457 family)